MTAAGRKAAKGEEEYKTTLPRVDYGKLFPKKFHQKMWASQLCCSAPENINIRGGSTVNIKKLKQQKLSLPPSVKFATKSRIKKINFEKSDSNKNLQSRRTKWK